MSWILQLSYLGEEVELDHGVGEGVGIGAEVGNHAQHGAVEGPVDLLEACLTRIVHVHHGHVPQEPARQTSDNTCKTPRKYNSNPALQMDWPKSIPGADFLSKIIMPSWLTF
jgi:hypothetical protein